MTCMLSVVAKQPIIGQVKTRLGETFSPQDTAAFYACMLQDTFHLMAQTPDVDRSVLYTPAEARAYFQRIAPADYALYPQRGADLAARLLGAFEDFAQLGYDRIVIMDSDSPNLPPAYLADAFRLLERHDAVFGPCEDGGYYLVGARRPHLAIFRGVRMSTASVLEDTLCQARAAGLDVGLLPAWFDVDYPADVARLLKEIAGDGARAPATARFLQAHRGAGVPRVAPGEHFA